VAPYRLTTPTAAAPGATRCQLHSVRSRRSWAWATSATWPSSPRSRARPRAGFLVVNPLHGSSGVPRSIRRLTCPRRALPGPDPPTHRVGARIRLRTAEIREQVDQIGAELRKRDLSDDLIDRDRVWEGKAQALRLLHSTPRTAGRSAAYRAYLAREGRPLRMHATWLTLAQLYGADCASWPDALRRADSPEVAELGEGAAGRDRLPLLAAMAARRAARRGPGCVRALRDGLRRLPRPGRRRAGGRCGHLADLDVYAPGVTIGAPADEFNQLGQDWSSRPWRPDRLAESGYLPYRQMLAGVLRHADGLRMDHVMALFRLWCGAGRGQAAPRHVRLYDHEALLAVLTLEAHRAGALVIGEDLGTVEPWVREALPTAASSHQRALVRTRRARRAHPPAAGGRAAWPPSPRTTCRPPPRC